MKENRVNPRLAKFFTVLLVLSPILNLYEWPIPRVALGEFLFIGLFPFLIFDRFNKKYPVSPYSLFSIYGIFISFIYAFYQGSLMDMTVRIGREIIYICILVLFVRHYFMLNLGVQLYKKVCLAVCAYLLIQFIVFHLTQITLPWVIPGVRLHYSLTSYQEYMDRWHVLNNNQFRPSSIFFEPSQLAHYVSPCLVLVLFPYLKVKKENYFLALFLSVAGAITFSANAFVYMGAVWGIWFVYKMITLGNQILKWIILTLFSVAVVFFIYLLIQNNIYLVKIIGRFSEINGEGYSSGNQRLFRGFSVYSQLKPIEEIFGIGYGNLESYINIHSIKTPYDYGDIEYMNTFSYILVSTGLLGITMFIGSLVYYFRRTSTTARVLTYLFMLVILSSSISHTGYYLLCLTFMFYLVKPEFTEVCVNEN